MLEKLKVQNFQRHESLRVDLDPNITAVTGPSDTGKSSLLRAIRWLATNKPRGNGFVRRPAGTRRMSVRLLVDGHTVKRERGGSENVYSIDGKEFRAFANDVPPEIQRVLCVGDVNFAGQHDSPFWFGLTGGELARELNRIVDLELIDEVMGRLAGRMRSLSSELEVVERRLEEARRNHTALSYVPTMAKELVGLEERWGGLAGVRSEAANVGGTVDEITGRQRGLGRDEARLKAGREVVEEGRVAVELGARSRELSSLLDGIEENRVRMDRRVPDLSGLTLLRDAWADASRKAVAWSESLREVRELEKRVLRYAGDLAIAKNKLSKETGGRCPLCGGPLEVAQDVA